MATVQKYVYESVESATSALPKEDDRFRVYSVVVSGKTYFVLERNPVTAIGRAADAAGVKAVPVNKKQNPQDVEAVLSSMDEETRNNLLAKYMSHRGTQNQPLETKPSIVPPTIPVAPYKTEVAKVNSKK